jgi:hypothetical protein
MDEGKATVTAYDGSILATWKTAKPSKRFSAELLKECNATDL